MQITTLSGSVYESQKKSAINNSPIAKHIPLGALQVNPDNTITVTNEDGTTQDLPISEQAVLDFCQRLRIPKSFGQRMDKAFDEGFLANLINMVKSTDNATVREVTLLVDPVKKVIDRVLPSDRAMISNEAFLDFVEPIIDAHDLGVTHFGLDQYGAIQLNCLSKNNMFKVPGMDTELFFTGVNFGNSPAEGLTVRSAVLRTLCTNSTIFADAFSLHSLNEKWRREFNEHMLSLRSSGFRPEGIEDKIRKANVTQASVAEMKSAMSAMQSSGKIIDLNFMQRYCPLDKVSRAYEAKGINIGELSQAQVKNAKAGITIWDLVNGMTNYASNDTRSNMDDYSRQQVMKSAGNLLYKKNYDTENLIQIDPFGNEMLLSSREQQIVRGDA